MEKKLTIGQFSKISKTSIDTIRHYHKKGVLIPKYQDSETGYRYYSHDQLSQIFIVKMFRNIGFSIKQISDVLKYDSNGIVNFQELTTILNLQYKSILNEIMDLEVKKEETKALIAMIGDKMSILPDRFVFESYGPRYFIKSQHSLGSFSTNNYMDYYFKLVEYSKKHNGLLKGPSSALVYSTENSSPTEIYVSHEISNCISNNCRIATIEEGDYVSISFTGYQSTEVRKKYYSKLLEWIDGNDLKYQLPLIEFYPITPGLSDSSENILTTLQIKVKCKNII